MDSGEIAGTTGSVVFHGDELWEQAPWEKEYDVALERTSSCMPHRHKATPATRRMKAAGKKKRHEASRRKSAAARKARRKNR